ncbi:MAG TPA: UPF0182 family protein [Gemmatimonadaceae bacterium]|nr:UPF0182 family protein [Gemmatimonadaceae bacterium]
MLRRRLLLGVVMAAALLVAGRALSATYADYTWYRALGATALWNERALDLILIYAVGLAVSFGIALTNFSTLASSIGALTLPRRLANVEFGEAVPRRYLDRFAVALALGVALILMPLLPSWESLALLRRRVAFQERDPYFHHDLAFYTTWLPFEKTVYMWLMLLVVTVALLVIALYSLTPGLRWDRSGLHMSTLVRRHLSVLATVILLLTMWSYRLASYDLLIQTGAEPGFSYVDHQWLLPGLLILSIATAAAAATMLFSGWTGQLRTSFVAVTGVIILSIAVQEVVPLIVERFTPAEAMAASERPYAAMRAEFTQRAYDVPVVTREGGPGSVLAAGDTDEPGIEEWPSLQQDSLVYPGAEGLLVVSDPQVDVAGQRLGTGLSRAAYAWAYQSVALLSDSLSHRGRIVTVRDVRRRLLALAPIFAQGNTAIPLFHADTLYWKVELYSASSDYPLSEARSFGGTERSYFRHAATALINGRTARVSFAPVGNPDPIAREWMRAFPHSADYRAAAVVRNLTPTPWDPGGPQVTGAADDSTFRARVTRLYNAMRAALAAGNLTAFSAAYDSLGALIRPPRE